MFVHTRIYRVAQDISVLPTLAFPCFLDSFNQLNGVAEKYL